MKKICIKCGVEKSLEEFNKSQRHRQGVGSWCKECKKISNRQYYRVPTEQRILQKNVRSKVQLAIYHGELKKEPCSICGSAKSQAHHPDYNKPLEVVWLCPPCHKKEHLKIKE